MPATSPVSVIIVNFNSGAWLSRCVRSLLDSTVDIEIFVGDNASTDSSLDSLSADFPAQSNLHIARNNANLGFAKAVNRLLSAAPGKWLLLLNPDCEVAPDTLEKMLAIMASHPQAGMGGCLIVNPDGSEQRGCRRYIPTLKSAALSLLGIKNNIDLAGTPLPAAPQNIEAISGAFMLIRRQALDAVGLLDEGYFMHCEDLDWCLRFTRAGWPILFVPDVRILHAKGVGSASRPLRVEWWKHKGMLRFWHKFYGQGARILLVFALAPAVLAHFLLSAAKICVRKKG